MARSTSSSDGSAPELMTVPGRGRGMSTLVTSAAAAAAALVSVYRTCICNNTRVINPN